MTSQVVEHMLHGPCEEYGCWDAERHTCKKGYGQTFQDLTTFSENE